MKFTLHIAANREEEILVFAKEKNELIQKIEELVLDKRSDVIGFKGEEIIKIKTDDVFCFTVENSKVFAILESEKVHIKMRLYELEKILPDSFIKINQSAIANLNKIERFSATFGASLAVHFKNGYTDYVSRRQVKSVKEKLGIRKRGKN